MIDFMASDMSFNDFGLTASGYKTPTKAEIEALILQTAKSLGIPTDMENYSIKEVYLMLASELMKRNYENEAYKIKQQEIETATGKYLDVLVYPITRLLALNSSVKIVLEGDNNTTIENGTIIKNYLNDDLFYSKLDYSITNTSCVKAILSVGDLTAGDYSITIDTTTIQTTITQEQIDGGLTLAQALNTIATNINNNTTINTKISANVSDEKLVISSLAPLDTFLCNVSDKYEYSSVSSVGVFYAVETGAIAVDANTINKMSTVISGLNSVNNPLAGSIGREEETDDELRARYYSDGENLNKYATYKAIKLALLNVSGVSFADVDEQKIAEIDTTTGSKEDIFAIKSVVSGGNDTDIAQAIWDTKAGGPLTTGSSHANAVDTNGVTHKIYFTRPTQKYAWINIKLYKTNDSTIPTDYIEWAKEAIMNSNYVKNHIMGQELTPCYIISAICSQLTKAIGKIQMSVAVSNAANVEPQEGDWSQDEIVINATENVVFDKTRITVEIFNS